MYGRSKRGACGYMFSRILGVPLLAVVAQGRAATIKGTIVLNEVGGQPMAKVQIIDSARTGGPWASGSDGGLRLIILIDTLAKGCSWAARRRNSGFEGKARQLMNI